MEQKRLPKGGLLFISSTTLFVVKSRKMWCQMKEPRMGHTLTYFPFGALSLVPQIAAFHNKLRVAFVTKGVYNMLGGDVDLAHVVLVACDVLLE